MRKKFQQYLFMKIIYMKTSLYLISTGKQTDSNSIFRKNINYKQHIFKHHLLFTVQ
jgi:hypothetical protein